MPKYINNARDSVISAVEFAGGTGGRAPTTQPLMLHVAGADNRAAAESWAKEYLPHHRLVGETLLNGQPVLMMQGDVAPKKALEHLRRRGVDVTQEKPSRHFDAWKWRGNLSNAGQMLQLGSAAFSNRKGFNYPVLGFAVFNLAANAINVIFGGEERPDVHRLRFLKEQFNAQVKPYVAQGAELPSSDTKQIVVVHSHKTTGLFNAAHDFLKRNSVVFGEIGLRYVGAFNLAFPIVDWVKAGTQAYKGMNGSTLAKLEAAMKGVGNNFLHKDKLIFYTGIAYLVGKTIALGSKVPDPYDPKPHSTIDTIREKVLFRLSTAIETGAAITLAANGMKKGVVTPHNPTGARLFTRERSYSHWLPGFMKTDRFIARDWLGAAGGSLFTAGLLIRFAAPFGTRELDTKELIAHMAVGLANVPPEKRAKLIADSAAALKAQIPEQKIDFSTLYAELSEAVARQQSRSLSSGYANSAALVAPTIEPTSAQKPDTRIHHGSLIQSEKSPAAAMVG